MASPSAKTSVDFGGDASMSMIVGEKTIPIDFDKSGRNVLGASHLSDETLVDTSHMTPSKNKANATTSMPDLSTSSSLKRIQPMTLREYEEQLSDLKKENFNLKLKIFKLQSLLRGTNNQVDVRMDFQVEMEEYETEIRSKNDLCRRMQDKIDTLNEKYKTDMKDSERKMVSFQRKQEKTDEEISGLNHTLAETQKLLNEEREKNEQLIDALANRRQEEFGGSDSDGMSQISLLGEKDRDILDLRTQIARLEYELQLKNEEMEGAKIDDSVSQPDPATPRAADVTGVEYGSILHVPEIDEALQKKVHRLENELEELNKTLFEKEGEAEKRNKVIQGLMSKIQKLKREGHTVSSVPSNWMTNDTHQQNLVDNPTENVDNVSENVDNLEQEQDLTETQNEKSVTHNEGADQSLEVLQSRFQALVQQNEQLQQVMKETTHEAQQDEELAKLVQFCDNSFNISHLLRDRLQRYVRSHGNDGSLLHRIQQIDQTGSLLFTPNANAGTPLSTVPVANTPASLNTPSFYSATRENCAVGSAEVLGGYGEDKKGAQSTAVKMTQHTLQVETVENETSFVMMETLVELHAAANLLNDTLGASSQDLDSLRKNMKDLREVCNRLYTKLRGSYQFLRDMLLQLGRDDEARRFQDDFSLLSQQLEDSLSEAKDVLDSSAGGEKRLTRLANDLKDVTRRLSLVASNADDSLAEINQGAGEPSPNEAGDTPLRSGASSSQSEGNQPEYVSKIPRRMVNSSVSQSPRNVIILKEQIKSVENSRREAQKELDAKSGEYEQLAKILEDRDNCIRELRIQIEEIKSEFDGERRGWEEKQKELNERIKELQLREEEYNMQMQKSQAEIVRLRAQIDMQSGEQDRMNDMKHEYEFELNRLQVQLEDGGKEAEKAKADFQGLQDQLMTANQEIAKLKAQKSAVDRATLQLTQFQQVVRDLQQQVDENESRFVAEKDELKKQRDELNGRLVEETNKNKMIQQDMLRVADELKVSRDDSISPLALVDKVAQSACQHRMELERLKQALLELDEGRAQLKDALESSLQRLEAADTREKSLKETNDNFLQTEKRLRSEITELIEKCESMREVVVGEKESNKKTVELYENKLRKYKERHEDTVNGLKMTIDKMVSERSSMEKKSVGSNTDDHLKTMGEKIEQLEMTVKTQKKQLEQYSSTLHKYTQINKDLSTCSPSRQLEKVLKSEKEKKDSLQDIVTQLEINNRLLEQKLDAYEKQNKQDADLISNLKRQLREVEKRVEAVEQERQALLTRLQQTPSSSDGDQKAGSLPEADMPSPVTRISQDRPRSSGSAMSRPDSTFLSPVQKQPVLYNELAVAVKELRRVTKYVKAGQQDQGSFDWKKCIDGLHATRYSVELCLRLATEDKENGEQDPHNKMADAQLWVHKNELLVQENGQLKELLASSQSLLAATQDKIGQRNFPADLEQGIVAELAKIRKVLQQSRAELAQRRAKQQRL